MPKLSGSQRKQVDSAELNSFEPLEEGLYVVKLAKDPEVKPGPAAPYWACEFAVVGPNSKNRKLWNNQSTSEKAAGLMKAFFAAFGVPIDTDTEDIVGETCRVLVTTEIQQQGAGKGTPRSVIKRFLVKDADAEAELLAGGDDSDDDRDDEVSAKAGDDLFDE